MGSQDGGHDIAMHIDPWRERILSQVPGWDDPADQDQPPAVTFDNQDDPTSVLDIGPPIDWHALWANEDPDENWLIEPLIAAGRLVSIYSGPKVGKSLLMLELAAGLATGHGVLGQPPTDPVRVLYVDFENDPRGDIRQRLKAMSYGPADLDNLRYYSYPTLSALDSRLGGLELLAVTRKENAALVVIDTVSRAVNGEENSNDTWLQFYRQTGLLLKREGVGCIRLDHSGKDNTKGQRGGSAKSGDVDAVWNLTKLGADLYSLRCEATRQLLPTDTLTLTRRINPLRHELGPGIPAASAAADQLANCMKWLDDLDLPTTAGKPRCRTALDVAGRSVSNAILEEAIRRRKTARNALGQVPQDQLPADTSGSSRAGTQNEPT